MGLRYVLLFVLFPLNGRSTPTCCAEESCFPPRSSFGALHGSEVLFDTPFNQRAFQRSTAIKDLLYQQTPAVVIIPLDAAAVRLVVLFLSNYTRCNHGVPLCVGVRGGGGSLIGRASSTGVQISLERLIGTDFSQPGLAVVGGGANWGAVQAAAIRHKAFLPTAECPALGVGGFTQHGGGTVMSRGLGLVVDNLVSIDIVSCNFN